MAEVEKDVVSCRVEEAGGKRDNAVANSAKMAIFGANGCLFRNSRRWDGMVNAESTTGAGLLSCTV